MKSALKKEKHRKCYIPLILLCLNFSGPVTTAYADLPITIRQPAKKVLWQPKSAAGKPAPYHPSFSSGQGSIISSGANKPVKAGQIKTAAGKPPALPLMDMGEQVVLQSRDISSYGPVWQSFSDYLTVPKGCEKAPFFLTFINGSASGPHFQDLRIKLAGKSLATIKDFNKQGKLTRNLTGAIGVGDSLLIVQAYGPAGAQFNWQFTTPKVEVTGVTPKEVALNSTITISGKNFSEQSSVNQVYFDKATGTVISATKYQLQVKVPSAILGGKADLVVAVGPSRSKPFKITVKSAPKINAVNMISTAPGQPLTITGEGFSTSSAENQVYFGDTPAQIVSCTPTSITCIVPVPSTDYPVWGLPVKVKTNGVDSTDPEHKGTINIQSRVFDSTPSNAAPY